MDLSNLKTLLSIKNSHFANHFELTTFDFYLRNLRIVKNTSIGINLRNKTLWQRAKPYSYVPIVELNPLNGWDIAQPVTHGILM